MRFASFTRREEAHVEIIVHRALYIFARAGLPRTPIDVRMDLAAAHATCPLRLEELAGAPAFDFAHDLVGIYRHLNRETGELENCFVPRLAAPEVAP